jgi:hypothetical protein
MLPKSIHTMGMDTTMKKLNGTLPRLVLPAPLHTTNLVFLLDRSFARVIISAFHPWLADGASYG